MLKIEDQLKLAFDFFKHLTTLNTAALVFVVSATRFVPKFMEKAWVGATGIIVGSSLLLCLSTMVAICFAPQFEKSRYFRFRYVLYFLAFLAIGLFLFGIACIGLIFDEEFIRGVQRKAQQLPN